MTVHFTSLMFRSQANHDAPVCGAARNESMTTERELVTCDACKAEMVSQRLTETEIRFLGKPLTLHHQHWKR